MAKLNSKEQCDKKNFKSACGLENNQNRREQKNLDLSHELNVTDKNCQDKKDCSNCVK